MQYIEPFDIKAAIAGLLVLVVAVGGLCQKSLLTSQNISDIGLCLWQDGKNYSFCVCCCRLRLNRSEQTFTVQHYGGKVTYDCELLLHENRNCIPDDIVSIFNKSTCQFNLVSKLFSRELKDIEGELF